MSLIDLVRPKQYPIAAEQPFGDIFSDRYLYRELSPTSHVPRAAICVSVKKLINIATFPFFIFMSPLFNQSSVIQPAREARGPEGPAR